MIKDVHKERGGGREESSGRDSPGNKGAKEKNVGREMVVYCSEDMDTVLKLFVENLGFRLLLIYPADSPRVATVQGHGARLRLVKITAQQQPAIPRLSTLRPPLASRFWLCRLREETNSQEIWAKGRAGMLYRDLIPDRCGGRFIASHIRIADAGPVKDYVHHHEIYFQIIYVVRGWVQVVYEDQGEPFVMQEGDCVLQPSGIRHRVLESSGPLEVIEVGSPAEHFTRVDHQMPLPTGRKLPLRLFSGQRFLHHVAAKATWQPWRSGVALRNSVHVTEGIISRGREDAVTTRADADRGAVNVTADSAAAAMFAPFESRDTGISQASAGAGSVRVARVARCAGKETTPDGHGSHFPLHFARHDAELVLHFVLRGSSSLFIKKQQGIERTLVGKGDSISIPALMPHAWHDWSDDFELLEVASPASVHWSAVTANKL